MPETLIKNPELNLFKPHKTKYVWIGGKRYYSSECGTVILPGTTTVLSATTDKSKEYGLKKWESNVGEVEANRIRKEATNRGTLVHRAIEWFLLGTPSDEAFMKAVTELVGSEVPEGTEVNAFPFWQSIQSFLPKITKVWGIELSFLNTVRGYAGSIDAVLEVDGFDGIILGDWKTASKPKKKLSYIKDYQIQAAAYTGAVNRLYGTKIKEALIVVTLADRDAEVFHIDSKLMKQNWEEWLERLEIYKSKEENDF